MRAGILLLVLAFAGCLAPDAAPVADVPSASAAAQAFRADVSLGGCREVGLGRFLSFEDAQALLPPGFVVADAAGFLAMPAPTGRAAVLSGHLSCESSVVDGEATAWADLIVPIERPDVPGLDLDASKQDVYQLAHFTSGRATADLFTSIGFTVFLADVTPELPSLAAPVARAATRIDGADAVRFETVGTLEQSFTLEARFWHVTPTGLAYVDHARTPTPLRLGALLSCEAAEASAFAEAFGTTACGDRDGFAGVFPEPSDIVSTLHHFPGASVARSE